MIEIPKKFSGKWTLFSQNNLASLQHFVSKLIIDGEDFS